jgi:hypothetical protein
VQEKKIMMETLAAMIYAASAGIVVVFQGCLAIGLPWGGASMGGRYPGKYPPKMRVVALANMILLGALIVIVMVEAGLMWSQLAAFSKYAIWFVVVFSGIGTVLNTITRSKIERIWAPVSAIQLITSLIVAVS